MFKSILLPTDGSPLSDKALATAIEFAQLTGGKITAICVIQPAPFNAITDVGVVLDASGYLDEMRLSAEEHVKRVDAAATAAGVPFSGLVAFSTTPYEEIIAAAEQHQCDLILMASHGRSGFDKFLMGSETQKVLEHTKLPVLVLH